MHMGLTFLLVDMEAMLVSTTAWTSRCERSSRTRARPTTHTSEAGATCWYS